MGMGRVNSEPVLVEAERRETGSVGKEARTIKGGGCVDERWGFPEARWTMRSHIGGGPLDPRGSANRGSQRRVTEPRTRTTVGRECDGPEPEKSG